MDNIDKEKRVLETKFLVAIAALKIIRSSKGGRLAINSSGDIVDMANFEGNVATTALEEIERINETNYYLTDEWMVY